MPESFWSTTSVARRRGPPRGSAPGAGRGRVLTVVLVLVAAAVAALPGTAAPNGGFGFSFWAAGVEHAARAVATATAPSAVSLSVTPDAGRDASEIRLAFAARAGERFYGLGERFGPLELTGQVVEVWTEDRAIRRKILDGRVRVPDTAGTW